MIDPIKLLAELDASGNVQTTLIWKLRQALVEQMARHDEASHAWLADVQDDHEKRCDRCAWAWAQWIADIERRVREAK